MFLRKLIGHGNLERDVVQDMERHIQVLASGCDAFHTALKNDNRKEMLRVKEAEREADIVRRDIVDKIFKGAFLPYLRPELARFVEVTDQVFDLLERAAACHLEIQLPAALRNEAARVALLNLQMCDMLRVSFQSMLAGEDLREKLLAIRIYEKRIDDLEFWLMKDARTIQVRDFWEGRLLSSFLTDLCTVSDRIEDAGDHLAIVSSIIK